MSMGLQVFDKTTQTTNIWLDEIMADIGPDRQLAWHVLGVVLRAIRDRVQLGLAAHLGSQLPLIIRGAYYDQWMPAQEALDFRTQEDFFEYLQTQLRDTRTVNPRNAAIAVFNVIGRHVPRGQCIKVRDALPDEVGALWNFDQAEIPPEVKAAEGKAAQNSRDARNFRARPKGQRRRA